MAYIQDISIIFTSVLLEALPFIILGVLLSAIIQEFVPDTFFRKYTPKNPFLASAFGLLMAFFIPACDCAIIPVSTRLLKKGVPLNVCVTFMLASPIINPVVIFSTSYAFGYVFPNMILYRTIFGTLIALIVGFLMSMVNKKSEILNLYTQRMNVDDMPLCTCGFDRKVGKVTMSERIYSIIYNAKEEFLSIIKYMIIGILLASIAQVFVYNTTISSITQNNTLQIVIMMLFAFFIALCSTADSFVAKTFLNQMSNNSILAFLLLGPMLDIKNTFVLLKSYNKKYVMKLLISVFALVFILSLIIKI